MAAMRTVPLTLCQTGQVRVAAIYFRVVCFYICSER